MKYWNALISLNLRKLSTVSFEILVEIKKGEVLSIKKTLGMVSCGPG